VCNVSSGSPRAVHARLTISGEQENTKARDDEIGCVVEGQKELDDASYQHAHQTGEQVRAHVGKVVLWGRRE
jgi:hypothetical protein